MAVRIFHGDDNDLYRSLVEQVLTDEEIEGVGHAGEPDEVVEGAREAQPDVVRLHQIGGADLVRRVRDAVPSVRVVVLSGYQRGEGDPELEKSVDGYVVKGADFTELRAVVLGG